MRTSISSMHTVLRPGSFLSLLAGALVIPAPASAVPYRYDHVVVVVEENRAAGQIIGDTTNAPYLNTLATGGVVLGSIYAIEHPSQPNYLQLFSGSNQGTLDDELPPNFSITPTATYPFITPNLGAEIISAGFSFTGYCEELETGGAANLADYDPHTATNPGVTYRRKHNPWANWVAKVSPIPANHLPSATNKPFTQFPTNFTLLPTVSFVVPTLAHDMHDGTRKQGDDWLLANMDAYAQWAKTHNSLLIVTWDEDDYNATNQIPTIFYGAALKTGTTVAGTWTLHNLLRTLEDMYGTTTHAGSAADTRSIVGAFTTDPTVLVKTFRQDLNGYTGAKDTQLWQAAPTTNNAATADLTADYDTDSVTSGNQVGQVLVRFDNLFGAATTQVPANAVIHSAKLILNTPVNTTGTAYDSNDTFRAHRMILDWTDTATWNSLTAGVSADNIEAASNASFSIVPDVDGGPAIIDVTSDVVLFKAGAATNRGWVVRPSSTGTGDGWTLKSSEASTVALRPSLEIVYSLATGYDLWAASKSLTDVNDDPLLNADGDSASNVLEYAFNLNPLVPDAVVATPTSLSGLPLIRATAVSGGTQLEAVFLRRKDTGNGLTYETQFSDGLASWQTGGTPTVQAIDASWERVTVKDSAPVSAGHRFARVKVTLIR